MNRPSRARLSAFDFKQSASQTHIVLTIVAATILAGVGCVLFMIATHGTVREDQGMLGAFIWLFFILGGSVVLIRSWRMPLRIEVGDDAFVLVDRHFVAQPRVGGVGVDLRGPIGRIVFHRRRNSVRAV